MNANDVIEFGVEVAHLNGEIVLAVRGDVDIATAGALTATVETFDSDGRHLVLDVSAVPFMDCAGLRVVARTLIRQQRSGGSLCIRNPCRQTRQILELSGLNQLLTIDETQPCD